jgi:muramoyltetrapeptide carboxypeptidase
MVASDFSAEGGVDLFSWQAALEGRNAGHQISQLEIIAPGSAEGRLYGGCLSLLAASLGTPYAIQTEGSILFLEDVSAKPFQIDRMLMQLRLARRLEGIRGIVFGRMRDCEAPTDSDYTLQDVLRRGLSDLDIPICYGLNSGHVENNNLTLPLGVQVRLLATEDFASLTFLEAAVMQN